MDDKKDRDIGHLFKEQMHGHEVPYEEGAWESMLPLLEEEDNRPLWIIWFKNQSKTFKTISIMTILGILAAVGVMLTPMNKEKANKNVNNSGKAEVAHTKTIKEKEEQLKESVLTLELPKADALSRKEGEINSDSNTKRSKVNAKLSEALVINPIGTSIQQETPNLKVFKPIGNAGRKVISDVDKTLNTVQNIKAIVGNTLIDTLVENVTVTQKKIKIVKKRWVEDYYTTHYYYDGSKPIKEFWMGGHFTNQTPDADWKSTNTGFNFQMMSGNIGKSEKFGLYAGLDWGMMFYGRTPNSNMIINTVNEDSGYTRLRNNSMDFLFRLHYEYPKHRVVPYANISLGPRFYYTNQKVASYLNLADNESQTRHNADFTASFTAGAAVGARVKVAERVSLDMRYELMYGTQTKQVELDKSTFSGLTYQLSKRTFNPNYNMIKVGVVIDLSSERKEKKLVEGHYIEESYDSLIVESTNDSTIIVIPCDCDCTEKSAQQSRNKNILNNNEEEDDDDEDRTWVPRSGSSGSSKGSKGSFPGIKTKPPVLK